MHMENNSWKKMKISNQRILLCVLFVYFPLSVSTERRQTSQLKNIDSSSIRKQSAKRPTHDDAPEVGGYSLSPAESRVPVAGLPTNSHGLQYYHVSEYSSAETQSNPDPNRKTSHKIDTEYQNNLKHHRYPPKEVATSTKFSIDLEEDEDEYKPSKHMENKQNIIKTILVKLLEHSEDNRKFAEVLPILKVMTPAQRLVLASLVTKQIMADGKNPGMDLAQVKSMFGNNSNITADLMLPIMLDIANLLRTIKDFQRKRDAGPEAQFLRSFSGSGRSEPSLDQAGIAGMISESILNLAQLTRSKKNVSRNESQRSVVVNSTNVEDLSKDNAVNSTTDNAIYLDMLDKPANVSVNATSEDLPVAEKLRRNGPPQWARWPPAPQRRRPLTGPLRRQELPWPAGQVPNTCNLFTETLCLDASDYPIHAIMATIRKNPGAMGALLSDFPGISADSAIDGVSSKQEDKYTPEHYLNNINRREDDVVRPKEASGFMCPSVVKYARPQKARATSGQWKYIVNTEDHTQTLRLEKCLQPKESCTYLTDNFNSKCVQIYNYHRLLTWDNQNGLHMDIFKVPTCCSCHIDGYSVAFPPLLNRSPELTSERFPGEDLTDADRNPFESVQHTVRRPVSKDILSALRGGHQDLASPPFRQKIVHKNKPPIIHETHFPNIKQYPNLNDNFQDIFLQQETNIRDIKKPLRDTNAQIPPSFLEPPSKTLVHPFSKSPDTVTKFKVFGNNIPPKRGAQGLQPNIIKRPIRKPIRKKNSQIVVEDQLVGASEVHENPTIINTDSFDEINDAIDDYDTSSEVTSNSKSRTLAPATNSTSRRKVTKISSTTTTERPSMLKPDRGTAILKDISLNRRVNYNYHPIIDFFEEGRKEEHQQAEDRSDSESFGYIDRDESDWKPMAGPIVVSPHKIMAGI